jgi:hypothetical protein
MMMRRFRSVIGVLIVLLIGATVQAELKLVVDFEGFSGTVDGLACNGVLGGVVDTESEGTGNASYRTQDGSNVMSVIGHSSGGLARAIGCGGISNPIDEGETGIGFFRFRVDGGNVRPHIGLVTDNNGDPVNSTNTQDPTTVPAGFRLVGSGAGMDMVTLDGATVLKAGLATAQWYNCWIVADNGADTFDLYLSTAAAPAGPPTLPTSTDLIASGIPFAVATTEPLAGVILANPTGTGQAARLYVDEIWWDGDQGLSEPTQARSPSPANGTSDVPRDVVLSWTPASSAAAHDVYFGTSEADVTAATLADPLGVLVGAGQDANTFDPAGLLEYGRTYYWRVDEVNATDSSVSTGNVWNFTVEPYAYPLTGITATASSVNADTTGPEKTIDGSGLDADDLHGTTDATMWISNGAAPKPAWIQYEFDRVYKLDRMLVWNANQLIEAFAGLGAKDVTVEYSTDGSTWTTLAGVSEFAKAPGAPGYAANTTVDFGGAAAQFVKLTINSNWGGLLPQFGLSEVRFYSVPIRAREPQPTSGQTDLNPNGVVLSWRAGREAVSHQVYLSTDSNAVAEGTALPTTGSTSRYTADALDFGSTYYWRVDEVNEAASPSAWAGDVWSFSTAGSQVIDDFESYTNDSPDRVFQTWIDGLGFSADEFFPSGNPGNGTGAIVGNDPQLGNIMETANARGRQAMPMMYDNISFKASEAQRTWPTAQNWATNGADTLSLYFRGIPAGFLELSSDHILMNGTGTDIWSTADQGRFVYKQLSGNGTIIARVDRLDNTDAWAKAGVMIRNTLDPSSTWTLSLASTGNGAHFQARLTAAGSATSDTTLTLPAEQTGVQIPVWVKLERIGDVFTAYYATGETMPTTWIANPWNPQTISMNPQVYIGLAVTSHAAGAVTQAEFSNVATTGTVTGSWQSVDLGVEQPAGNIPDRLYVTVEDASGGKATVAHADPYAVLAGAWTPWDIPLSTLTGGGVKTDSIKKMSIGVGDKDKPASGASGTVFIDDIAYGRAASE